MQEGLPTHLDPDLTPWAVQAASAVGAVLLATLPDGEPQAVSPGFAARFGAEIANLFVLFPESDTRRAAREALEAGAPWTGEIRPGLFATLVPLGTGRPHAAWVELSDGRTPMALLAARTARAERDARRSQRLARWRDAEHSVASVVGGGASVRESADAAVNALSRALMLRDTQIYQIEGEQLVRVAGSGPEIQALADSPAILACARRATTQQEVRATSDFPAMAALAADGVRAVLHVPVECGDRLWGVVEVRQEGRPVFLAEEVEVVVAISRLLAGAVRREHALIQAATAAQVAEVRAALEREQLGRSQDQLLHAARLSSIGELAAGLVHEMSQPLNVLGGYVELLQDVSFTEASRIRALAAMSRAVERMSGLVDNLRSFARGGAARMAPVSVSRFVGMARELTGGALKRGVQLECPEDLMVRGDESRLEQVFVNLIANALQAGGDPVEVVAGPMDGGGAWIEVRDRGPGVPEVLRERVFEAFFTTKPPGQGTGLGLAVSSRIVRDHGGTIVVLDREGGGAVFRVELPGA